MAAAASTVSPYQAEDAETLAGIHNRAFPAKQIGPLFFSMHLDSIKDNGGRVWVLKDSNRLVGYAHITPVPGLPTIFDLQGCIDPDKQRQGFGRFLLRHIIAEMKANGRFELSYAVPALDTPTARFLTSQQFRVEHIEQRLLLVRPESVSFESLPQDYKIGTFDQETAVHHFQRTYHAIFQGLPWYQPYTEDWEVIFALPNSADLLFLLHKEIIAGFAWLRRLGPQIGEIEPFGLLPAYQGKGLAYPFLATAIRQLINKGINQVQIGAWQSNERAINLYQKIGFKPSKTIYYLAYTY